jgi:hypothetical protein
MIWIAPSEKDTDSAALEKRLWDAADQSASMKNESAVLAQIRHDRTHDFRH